MRRKSTLVRQLNSKVSGPIEVKVDTLIQGVSQQPPHLRLVGQGEEQVNAWSSPVEGLCKRNPLRITAKILPTPVTDFYMEMMSVTSTERYSVMLYPDGTNTNMLIHREGIPAVVDVHGTGLGVVPLSTFASPMSTPPGGIQATASSYFYNAAGSYAQKYALINTGALGLLLNREKSVAMASAASPVEKNEALIFVQGVAYSLSYVLTLDGTKLPAVTTPAATDTNNQISTSTIAQKLADEVNKISGFTAVVQRYTVHVYKTNGAEFTMSMDDGRGNSFCRVIKGQVTSTSELPTVAPNGYVIKVSSDPTQSVDDRYLKFTTIDGGPFDDGVWSETVKPGIQYKMNAETLPFVIYRAAKDVLFVGPADGASRTMTVNGTTYSYTFPSWGERTAGDTQTTPSPDFVGKPIRDHIFFRNRYAVAAGQSIVFSESGDVFNFFNDTSVAVLATDTFGVIATSEVSSELNWLLPVDETLLAFSRYSQFQIKPADADVLTAYNAIVLRLSNLEMDTEVRPKLAGPQILFATNEYGYTHFREYSFIDSPQRRLGLNLGGSNDICTTVPKYIQGLVTHWDVGESIDLMVCSTPVDRKTLYVYKYLFSTGQQGIAKQQASWSKYVLNGDVRWIKFMDNQLYLVMTYADGTYATYITSDELETKGSEQVHLDRLLLYPECNQGPARITAAYDATTRKTTFTLPYQINGQARAVIRYTNDVKEGLLIGSATSGNQIVCDLHGDFTGDKIAFGEEYEMKYEFTQFHVPERDQARSRVVGKQDGRTQVLHLTIFHHNTGRYDVRITRQNRQDDSVHRFRARLPNVANNRLTTETSHLESGQMRVPVYSANNACRVMIESRSWLPLTITGASWEGSYSNRSKGVG